MIFNAFLYSVGVYVLLFIIALLVAGLIKVMYNIIHKSEPKPIEEKKVES